MKTKSTLLFAALLLVWATMCAYAQVKNRVAKISTNTEINDDTSPVTVPAFKASTSLFKIPSRTAKNENSKLKLYGIFTYNYDNSQTEKTIFNYDKQGRETEDITYIHNNYNYSWMSNFGQWIISRSYKSEYDNQGNTLKRESMYLDIYSGNYSGSKYIFGYSANGDIHREMYEFHNGEWHLQANQDYNNVGLYITNETYRWDSLSNSMIGSTKYSYTITQNGNNYERERFTWAWNNTTKTWTKNINKKLIANYVYTNNHLFTISSKNYDLVGGIYTLTNETTYTPNYQALGNTTSVTKTVVNGILTNQSKTTTTYDAHNNIVAMDNARWLDNQWKSYYIYNYSYSTPDSIVTEIGYETLVYYQIFSGAAPTLCSGQTNFPDTKYIYKFHPVSRLTEIDYSYYWNSNMCRWEANGQKYTCSYDSKGELVLSETNCYNPNGEDWTGCSTTENTYDMGMIIKSVSSSDDSQSRTKSEFLYTSDSLLKRINKYRTVDLNNDGSIDSDEWIKDGYVKYSYSVPTTGDSIHISVSSENELSLYTLPGNVKKLKVTGPLSCDDLEQISQMSWDSLEVADLSDVTLQGDTLHSCLDEIALTKLVLPKTLKVIDQEAIVSENDEEESRSLKELVIYPDVEKIENGAFYILNLEKATIPSQLFSKLYSFAPIPGINDVYKSTLKSVTFNDGSGKIKDAVCYNMPYLQQVTILDGATEIGNNAFKSCGMLREINLPITTLQKIGYNAFWGCNELTTLTLPEGLNTIDYSAFWGCSGVTSISMPSSLTNIAQNAFWGCSAVASMKVAALTPPVLGNNALQGVPREASVVVPETGIYAYKAAPQWKEFFNINTDIQNDQLRGVLITSANGELSLQNLPLNVSVNVYSLTGARITSLITTSKNQILKLTKGAYVIQVGSQYIKTLVK